MTHVLSFDLGNRSGWAWFHSGELSRAWFGSFEDLMGSRPLGFGGQPAKVLIETPSHAWRMTVEDAIGLGIKVGRVEEFYLAQGCLVKRVVPTAWKGSVDVDVMLRRIEKCLTPVEVERVPRRPRKKDFDHNCLDAIGLGLWDMGRLR